MKLIFLDIDGVLNSAPFLKAHAITDYKSVIQALLASLDPEAIERLNRIVDVTGARIVVSSVWRAMMRIGELQKAFERAGLKTCPFSQTPQLGTTRGREIQSWLDRRRVTVPVESFVILDDDADMEHLLPRLVQTSMDDGLQDRHVEKAVEILNRSRNG
jgi:hypothetical protein